MNNLITIRKGSFVWRLLAEMAGGGIEQWLGPDGFLLPPGRTSVVKRASHRAVYRVQAQGMDLHIKEYGGGLRDWARCLLRGGRRAPREFTLSLEVARRGVPTVEVLGVGERYQRLAPSNSVLITRTLPNTQPLLDYLEYELPALPEVRRVIARQRLAEAVGALLATQHRAGVRHGDLHPGNMLIRFVDEWPQLFLIDLDKVRVGPPLNWTDSLESLVILDRWFALRFSRTDRLRAWRSYLARRVDLSLDEHESARVIAQQTQDTLIEQMRQFDRRCLGGNRHYRRIKGGLAVTELDPCALDEVCRRADQLLNNADLKTLKRSESSVVVELELPIAGRPRAVVFKRLKATWKSRCLAWLRWPPAMRSYVFGHGLRLRGVPTPRPLAVWHRWGRGYLLTEKVPQAVHLRAFVEQYGGEAIRRRLVIEELARYVRQMHDMGLSHRDLKAANILISPTDHVVSERGLREIDSTTTVRRDRVWFVDLVGVHRQSKVSRLRRVRDLARLHLSFLEHPLVSRTDRLRFLRIYLVWGLAGKLGWKQWWREVHQVAMGKAGRNVARGRVIG